MTSPIAIQIPGAVPIGFGSGSAPSGKSACTRLLGVIRRFRRAKSSSIARRLARSSTSVTPATDARAARARSRDPQALDVLGHVIGQLRVVAHLDAGLAQPLGDPLAVGVELLPTRQLAPDRDDLGVHRGSILPAR
jgi:hypothetical protein